MNYYYDTEFLEGTQKKRFLGIHCGNTPPTIDLISIGIISDDNREYYAISKDFNLKEAWNRYDIKKINDGKNEIKEYWIRENILRPIFYDYYPATSVDGSIDLSGNVFQKYVNKEFTYKNLKNLINKYGKTNKQIAEEVFQFCTQDTISLEKAKYYNNTYEGINLYGYYSAYDHVAFCWLFGKMIDLPKGFPMYSKDLKQMLDEAAEKVISGFCFGDSEEDKKAMIERSLKGQIKAFKTFEKYPKQTNEHNALADAKWNKELHKFIKSL
jgi:hypothetical protein